MKNYLLLFIANLSLCISVCRAQMDSLAQAAVIGRMEKTDPSRHYRQILDSCEKYLKTDFSVSNFKGKLFAYKAMALSLIHDSLSRKRYERGEDPHYDSDMMQEIDALYDKAAVYCTECRFTYLIEKYEYEESYNMARSGDLELLTRSGYKEDYQSVFVAMDFYSGNNYWAGAEVSWGYKQPQYKIREKSGGEKTVLASGDASAASILNVGYRKNFSAKGWGMNISPLTVMFLHVSLRPLNFTYLNGGTAKSWGYCPEIGLTLWHLYVHYGYNLAFRKSMRSFETHLLNVRLSLPIHKWKN